MLSEIFSRAHSSYERLDVPPFPVAAIRAAAQRSVESRRRRQVVAFCSLASLLFVAVAAGAAILHEARIHVLPSGGMVIRSHRSMRFGTIHSGSEILDASKRLNFSAVLPDGLPAGSKPISFFTADSNVLAVTYSLPGGEPTARRMLTIVLSNPSSITRSQAEKTASDRLQPGLATRIHFFRVGSEEVTVQSNGLTEREIGNIEYTMLGDAH